MNILMKKRFRKNNIEKKNNFFCLEEKKLKKNVTLFKLKQLFPFILYLSCWLWINLYFSTNLKRYFIVWLKNNWLNLFWPTYESYFKIIIIYFKKRLFKLPMVNIKRIQFFCIHSQRSNVFGSKYKTVFL